MSVRNDAKREAEVWYVRLESEAATEQDWLEFERWLTVPENKSAYEALEVVMAAVDAQRGALAASLKTRASQRLHLPAPVWATGLAAVAAAVALLVFLTPNKPQEFAYAAPIGATRMVTLPDDSVVQLNRGASVRVSLDARSRQVVIERGEASFSVRHDAGRPFVVAAGRMTIRDVGTEFDVVRTDAYAIITVLAGRVSITTVRDQAVELGAGEQGRVDQANGLVSVVRTNAADAVAWRAGRLLYRNATLSKIVEDLNRYSSKPIVVVDDRAGALRFSGVLVIDDAATMVRRLEAFLPIQSAQNANRIELRSRP